MLGHPGAEEGGQSHASGTAFGTTGSSADFASNNQRANTALSEIVVSRHSRYGDKDKEFREKAFHPFA